MKKLILLLLFLFHISEIMALKIDIENILPENLLDWKIEEKTIINENDQLYDLIDGGAELYISYGFYKAVSITFTKKDQPEVRVEIFDMQSSKNAFGVFTHTRYSEDNEYGQGSNRLTGALLFWKGKYYTSIMTIEETDESVAMMNEIASLIDTSIEDMGKIPKIVNLLPKKDMVEAGYTYFHHYIWQNSYYFIANENILNIDETTDAVYAKYFENEKIYYLLLIQYPDDKFAKQAYKKFTQAFFPEGIKEETNKIEDGTWTGCKLNGNYFIGVFNAESKNIIETIIDRININ